MSTQEVTSFQSVKSLNFKNLSVTLVANHRENYKGEGDCFPRVQAVVIFVSPCMPKVYPCTKSDPTMH
jgi:hypothetical protein